MIFRYFLFLSILSKAVYSAKSDLKLRHRREPSNGDTYVLPAPAKPTELSYAETLDVYHEPIKPTELAYAEPLDIDPYAEPLDIDPYAEPLDVGPPIATPTPESMIPTAVEMETIIPTAAVVCDEDIQVVHIEGAEDYPTKDAPVRILSQDTDTVTVLVRQTFSSSGIDNMFLQYKETQWSETCEETREVEPSTSVTDGRKITIQCNSKPFALMNLMLVDEHGGLEKEGNDARIPQCCHPDVDEGAPTVIFNLLIWCESQCAPTDTLTTTPTSAPSSTPTNAQIDEVEEIYTLKQKYNKYWEHWG